MLGFKVKGSKLETVYFILLDKLKIQEIKCQISNLNLGNKLTLEYSSRDYNIYHLKLNMYILLRTLM